jgi:VWFA-related protein
MKSPLNFKTLKVTVCLVSAGLFLSALPAQSLTQTTDRRLKVIFVDDKNHSLDNVQEQDIEVLENGVRQQVKIEKQQLPARYVVLVDTSGSLRSQFPNVLETARGFIRSNNATDETAIIRFVTRSVIQVVQPFTFDKALLLSKVETLKILAGQTSVLDAVYASIEYVDKDAKKDPGRNNAVVVITDGENRDSVHNLKKLLELVRAKNIRVYTIGLVSELDKEDGFIRKGSKKRAEELLSQIAESSGGRTFFVEKPNEFPEAILEIAHDLHSDYLITYPSTSASPNLKIEIKVTKSPDNKKRRAIFKAVALD